MTTMKVSLQQSPTLPNLDTRDIPDMPSIIIDIDGVTRLLQGVNPSKASGPDMLPTRVLKTAAPVIAPFLTLIFQQSTLALYQMTGNMPT